MTLKVETRLIIRLCRSQQYTNGEDLRLAHCRVYTDFSKPKAPRNRLEAHKQSAKLSSYTSAVRNNVVNCVEVRKHTSVFYWPDHRAYNPEH